MRPALPQWLRKITEDVNGAWVTKVGCLKIASPPTCLLKRHRKGFQFSCPQGEQECHPPLPTSAGWSTVQPGSCRSGWRPREGASRSPGSWPASAGGSGQDPLLQVRWMWPGGRYGAHALLLPLFLSPVGWREQGWAWLPRKPSARALLVHPCWSPAARSSRASWKSACGAL